MALTKKFLKTKPVCKVTFKVASDAVNGADALFLVGDFNDWEKSTTPMKKNKAGEFSATVDLAVGNAYQFKYLAAEGGEERWFNDDAPDRLEWSDFAGAENSVVAV
ncbi:isoamylase early set domain-containing protein [Megalodesulfovibrio paquesii]